ncbi:MAG: GNAT family N-acetyltransferase [Casimicrobiaceae bacterium]
MTFAIQHLNACIRDSLVAHFLALPMKDRSLRFGSSLAPTVIAAYVDRIDFDRDAVFGIHDDRLDLIGVAHMAVEDDLAELALSVLPAHRRRGVGSALFRRAAAHARARRVPRLYMHCRSDNSSIMRIAQKFDMDIAASGGDAQAHLQLQRPRAWRPGAHGQPGNSPVKSPMHATDQR